MAGDGADVTNPNDDVSRVKTLVMIEKGNYSNNHMNT